MTAPITLIIDGVAPVAKARPRMTRRGQVYTPARTASYERMIGQLAALEMRGRPPLTEPLADNEAPPSASRLTPSPRIISPSNARTAKSISPPSR